MKSFYIQKNIIVICVAMKDIFISFFRLYLMSVCLMISLVVKVTLHCNKDASIIQKAEFNFLLI